MTLVPVASSRSAAEVAPDTIPDHFAVDEANAREDVRAIVIHGNEAAFCSGNDMGNFAASNEAASTGQALAERPSAGFMRSVVRLDKPLLGICRGMQLINVALGGSLFQDLRYAGTDQQHMAMGNPASPLHHISVEERSFLHDAWGVTKAAVNSFHHPRHLFAHSAITYHLSTSPQPPPTNQK